MKKISDIFGKGHLTKKTNRNAFDLSRTTSLTAPFGALLPIDYMEVPANSYVELSNELQTIMTPTIRPPFGLVRQHIDYFAVPMVQLYQPFDNFITGIGNYDSSAVAHFNRQSLSFAPKSPNQVPMLSGKSLMTFLAHMGDVLAETPHPLQDVFNFSQIDGSMRLLDLLGYGNFYKYFSSLPHILPKGVKSESTDEEIIKGSNNTILPVNLFNLLAYQKIYYSYYNNSNYERKVTEAFNIDDLKPMLYDNDYLTGDSGSDVIPYDRLVKMFEMHYRWQNKDYFTDVQPQIFPYGLGFEAATPMSTSFIPLTDNSLSGWSLFSVPGSPTVDVDQDPAGRPSQNESSYVNLSLSGSGAQESVSQLRLAFAFDKLLRRMRQAGASFNSQMLAQFGIKPIDYRHGDVIYLGGHTNLLRFDEVTSTAETSDASLGTLGGKMTAYNNNARTIKYTAREDCIIMAIYSTSIDTQYHSFNVDRCNLRRFRFDWFNPEFENLGMQALFAVEYNMLDTGQQFNNGYFYPALVSSQKDIIGFVKRYMEYKTRPNRVHSLFQWPYDNSDARAWVIQKHDVYYDDNSQGDVHQQQFIPFAMPNLLQNPLAFNDITVVKYNGSWETDHFNIFCLNRMKLVANMSKIGEVF